MQINGMVSLNADGEVAVVTVDNPPVNALAADVRDGIYEAVSQAIADPAVKAIVLMCAGRTFVAGGDISALGSKQAGKPVREVGRLIAASPKPVVAAIHGSALGGGLEISLATHWRVCTPDAKVGLPEVKLGILPGAGGTQRLPRLVGAEKALDMIVFGDAIPASEALACGVVDAFIEEGRVRESAVAFARKVVAENRPLKLASDATDKVAAARAAPQVFDDFLAAHPETFRGALAPINCLESVRAAFTLPFEEGLDLERKLMEDLIYGQQCKAMCSIFFAERDIFKIPGVGRDAALAPVRKVAVLAANPDGIADARAFAGAGLSVVLFDLDAARLAGAQAPAGVTKSAELAALADCDLVLDPTFGPPDAQRALIAAVAPALRPDALVSTLALAAVGDLVSPERLVGVHFFYPGDQRRFVEVVRTDATSGRTAATVTQLLKRMGKLAMLVKPDPLGVASRMMRARQASAEVAVLQGAATPAAVDQAFYDFGFPEGVFAWEDRIGLDVGWIRTGDAGDALRAGLCAAGRTGRKANRGFYDYDAAGVAVPSPEAEAMAADLAAAAGFGSEPLTGEALLRRLLFPIVNEGAKLLEEGLVIRASDIDMMWVATYGWPAYQGGPMFYGEALAGLPKVVEGLKALQARFGDAYRPCALLERLAAEGKGFAAL
jgi:3-hydroxyacyl-CoA dehydrogenase